MELPIPFRAGDEKSLAEEFIHLAENRRWRRQSAELKDPASLEEERILAVHYADLGAQGDPGAVEILLRTGEGVQILYGNYALDLDLDAVIRKLPMLKCLDSRGSYLPPYPFGGRLEVPSGWAYQYMGAMNHLFVRREIADRSADFVRIIFQNGRGWQMFDAIAWLCGAG